ncbi:MAG: ABC transporter substrate-binding protein, partial [Bdellovibrionota bacterium]
ETLKDLFQTEGVIALQSGLTYAQFLKKKYAPVKAKLVPYQGGISYIQNPGPNAQQGFLTSEPLVAEKAGIKVKTFLVADEGFNPYTTVLAVRKKDLDKDPAKFTALVNAVRTGWEHYLRNPAKAHEIMQALNKSMDAETFKQSAAAQKSLIDTPVIGEMKENRWVTLIDQLKEFKTIKKKVNASKQFQNL